MPLEPFATSAPLTFGVELELQLVSLSDFDLTPASPDLMHLLKRKPFPGNVTPEITESMIEINSSVQTNYRTLLAELLDIRDTLVAASDVLNIGIAGGGTHPGSGLPVIYEGARISVRLLLDDLGIEHRDMPILDESPVAKAAEQGVGVAA